MVPAWWRRGRRGSARVASTLSVPLPVEDVGGGALARAAGAASAQRADPTTQLVLVAGQDVADRDMVRGLDRRRLLKDSPATAPRSPVSGGQQAQEGGGVRCVFAEGFASQKDPCPPHQLSLPAARRRWAGQTSSSSRIRRRSSASFFSRHSRASRSYAARSRSRWAGSTGSGTNVDRSGRRRRR